MWWRIAGVVGVCAAVYRAAMRAVPGRGWVKVCEKGVIGTLGVFLGNVALGWFGARMALTPVSALLSGYLGLPGALLAWVVQRMP